MQTGRAPFLLINLSEPFSTRPSDRAHVWIETRLALTKTKLTNPTPEGFRGLFIDVCGMFVACLWVA